MRDFSWKYFTMTGDLESYLLFKAVGGQDEWGLGDETEGEVEETETEILN